MIADAVAKGAKIMLGVAMDHLKGNTSIEKVSFCLFGQDALEAFKKEYDAIAE